jgi:UDP-N-acetylglucosamine 2-epimerase (non-hydrolysing)
VILVVFGTTGELIKLAPVLVRLRDRDHEFMLVTTGQQVTQIPPFLDQFGLDQPGVWLARGRAGRDLATSSDIPGWASRVIRSFARQRNRLSRRLHGGPGRPLVLVHGDTMTTVLGALMGRMLRVPVAHIEGGLRSGDLRNPFPEELNRRLTSRIATIHYAPGHWAVKHLHRGTVIDTGSNTVRDSLELVPSEPDPAVPLPSGPFGIVSLHRFELLNSRGLLTESMRQLAEAAKRTPLLFVDHSVTAAALDRFGLDHLLHGDCFIRIPRLRFFDFVQLERRCAFVVTDSGGSQQECYYLDKPCLVHRRRTEWMEGLGENIILSEFNSNTLHDFLAEPSRHRRVSSLPAQSPGDVIVDDLEARGFATAERPRSVSPIRHL